MSGMDGKENKAIIAKSYNKETLAERAVKPVYTYPYPRGVIKPFITVTLKWKTRFIYKTALYTNHQKLYGLNK